MSRAASAKAIDGSRCCRWRSWATIADRFVLCAPSETTKTDISIAGSARAEKVISRLAPMPPKAVPMSMPARASQNRARASSAAMAMTSPIWASGVSTKIIGTMPEASRVAVKTTYGAKRNTQEAFPASTTSLPNSLARSR